MDIVDQGAPVEVMKSKIKIRNTFSIRYGLTLISVATCVLVVYQLADLLVWLCDVMGCSK